MFRSDDEGGDALMTRRMEGLLDTQKPSFLDHPLELDECEEFQEFQEGKGKACAPSEIS